MKYNTVYVGMDVHKETFSLCCYTNEKEQAEYPQKVAKTAVARELACFMWGMLTGDVA